MALVDGHRKADTDRELLAALLPAHLPQGYSLLQSRGSAARGLASSSKSGSFRLISQIGFSSVHSICAMFYILVG